MTVPLLNADDLSTLPVADVLSRFHAARDWYYTQGAASWEADAFGHWITDVHGPIVHGTYSDALSRFHYSDAGRAYYRAHARRPCGYVHGYRWTYGQPLVTDAPIGGGDLADLIPLHPCYCPDLPRPHLLTDPHPGDPR